jgi:selenocysteine lyase/cysteine desulfurase
MDVSRRHLILRAAGLQVGATALQAVAAAPATATLPAKSEFPVVKSEVCLNNARWHPASTGSIRAIKQYLDYKAGGGGSDPTYSANLQTRAKSQFAALIHAQPAELSFIPSTTVGENLIAFALDLPRAGGNIVTDALHFESSLSQYGELAKQGTLFEWLQREYPGRYPGQADSDPAAANQAAWPL